MKPSNDCYELIKKYEGLRVEAYLCPASIPTIGYGNTRYEDGTKVKLGDKITLQRAEALLRHMVDQFAVDVTKLIKVDIKQNQFDSLVCFAYNVGLGNLKSSTLLKKVNAKAPAKEIETEFLKWNRGGGKVLLGLTKRRKEEADLFNGVK